MGDLNCTLSSKDRSSARYVVDGAEGDLVHMITELNLVDIWRKRNPETRQYTFKRGTSRSRIDMILVPIERECDVTRVGITNCPYSDHSFVHLTINIEKISKGPGIWIMNKRTIQSEQFRDTFNAFWDYWKYEIKNYDSIKIWWELTKKKIKEITINISKALNRQNKNLLDKEKKLDILLRGDDTDENEINKLKTEIKESYKIKSDGYRIRSKIKYYENNEKSTKYFLCQEKNNAKNKIWRKIKLENGDFSTDIKKIMEEQTKFYSNLFSTEGWNLDSAENILQNVDAKLTCDERQALESDITDEELLKSINQLKKNKSPGEDGIIAEFYQTYWEIIKPEFTKLVKEILLTETLPESFGKGILTLIYKKGERERTSKIGDL
ncbi:hypothetical protein FSP39_020293 [Pinctada imbricata]|uniref:Endonuclease/exonuclease/phosphatase domain-containing protein n=1 Tax=Pinctada imbricata TaxID=66713 RepID=A0AA88XTJ6_PINIB|nr:hypothetical protein FSP39_020293 [Pinctada imbricata]